MADTPNIIIIMTDQQRADLSHREGFPLDTTPFMDSLAGQGVWFNRAYTSMPVCAPARVSMLTGRYPSAHRVRTNHNIEDAYFAEDLFDVFRKRGYSTALFGKNHSHLTPEKTDFWYECGHLGTDEAERTPREKAFDDWLKTTHFHISMEAAPFPVECQIPYRLVSKAEGWIESVKDRPFLLWLSFPEPHNPYQVPVPYYSMFPPETIPPSRTDSSALDIKGFKFEWCRRSFMQAFPDYETHIQRARANYLGMLRLLDDQVKRFVQFLDQTGLRDNTLIVLLSDHGDFVGEYGLLRKGPELPEPLVRIPLQLTGPGIVRRAEPHPAHVS
ncbi:MAG: sulfatase-like hydrolase/transferase, partial [Armatimonadetes bacterium]|nr:sulfatase-like hydrolase/transferase [Armatimonadota bacterium]